MSHDIRFPISIPSPNINVLLNARDKDNFIQPGNKWQLPSTVQAGGIDEFLCAVNGLLQASYGPNGRSPRPERGRASDRLRASGASDCRSAITSVVASGTSFNCVVGRRSHDPVLPERSLAWIKSMAAPIANATADVIHQHVAIALLVTD
jgi:hypothetical protein